MRRILVLVSGILMLALLTSGCKIAMDTHADSGRTVVIDRGQQFIIAIGSNPTTGYSWQASYDEKMLQLVEKTYEPSDQSKGVVGAGGIEFFRFEALKKGETELTVFYKRPWEETVVEQKSFTVIIK